MPMPWPETLDALPDGRLTLGGVALTDLATKWGTPLYVYDEATLRHRARAFRHAFATAYPHCRVVYAAKAYCSPAIIALLHAEGLGLDVVSGGELYVGRAAGVDPAAITFHGNNKSETELRTAVMAGVGLIALDNARELALLARLTAAIGTSVSVLVRINPGIDVHTHAKIRTGIVDAKFGWPLAGGDAAAAVAAVLATPGLTLAGYHAHVGSQLTDVAAATATLERLITFAAAMRDRHGVVPAIISPGGGYGIAYGPDDAVPAIAAWAAAIGATLRAGCAAHGLPEPELVVEPGRAIVGPAAITLYQVGAIKSIAGVRTYVAVDGGMADNIRPALYGANYTARLANRRAPGPEEVVTIAGRYCESGDVLIEHTRLPRLTPDDLLAVAATGAYCLAMASNYNHALRPAVVLVANGQARLIRRRETDEDLLAQEIWANPSGGDRPEVPLAGPVRT